MSGLLGINAASGAALDGTAHLAQSVADILTTPIGTRVMRRDYGSMLFDLIDQPLNSATRLLIFAATALALTRWEPRLRLRKVALGGNNAAGELTLELDGELVDPGANSRVLLSVPIRKGGLSTAYA